MVKFSHVVSICGFITGITYILSRTINLDANVDILQHKLLSTAEICFGDNHFIFYEVNSMYPNLKILNE